MGTTTPTYEFRHGPCGVRLEEYRPHERATEPGPPCPVCRRPLARAYSPLRAIVRPSGYRRSPEDPAFSDFRRELELGELTDDATPVTLSPAELAAWDNPPVTIPPDPARDHALAQAVRQNWTNDLPPGVAYHRELAAKRAREEATSAP